MNNDLLIALCISMLFNFIQIAVTNYFIWSKVIKIEQKIKKPKEQK